jgi:hypothetical protein
LTALQQLKWGGQSIDCRFGSDHHFAIKKYNINSKKLGDLTFDMFFISEFISGELFTNQFFIGKILVSISN